MFVHILYKFIPNKEREIFFLTIHEKFIKIDNKLVLKGPNIFQINSIESICLTKPNTTKQL